MNYFRHKVGSNLTEETLDKLGIEGWQLVSVCCAGRGIMFYLKKEIPRMAVKENPDNN